MKAWSTEAIPLDASTVGRLDPSLVALPRYDRSALRVGIVHVGVGGFHRAHQAWYLDALMNAGLAHDWAVCGVGLMPGDRRMATVMATQNGLYTVLAKAPDGSLSARVVGSIIDYVFAPDEPERVLDVMTAPQVRLVTMTVTESGYNLRRVDGTFDPDGPGIAADVATPARPRTVFGFIVEALSRRRASGAAPFAVVSCDNVQHNGRAAREGVVGFARLRDPQLAEWIDSEVPFPNSMVDRITPATTDADRRIVREHFGVEDAWPVVCEPFARWVLEDTFPGGRPPLERAGVQLVGDVAPYELMKLRLLNASHQALGYAGMLCGHRYVHDAMADPLFVGLLRRYMSDEATPSLHGVPSAEIADYVEQVIERFANRAVGDQLARLCVDSADRLSNFVLPVLRHQLATGGPIDCATAIIACWARWVEVIDEPAAARRDGDDPLAFVNAHDLFSDLVDDPRFTDTFRSTLGMIRRDGTRAALSAIVGAAG